MKLVRAILKTVLPVPTMVLKKLSVGSTKLASYSINLT